MRSLITITILVIAMSVMAATTLVETELGRGMDYFLIIYYCVYIYPH